METFTVTYTAEEASVQLKLNDMAVRHGGMDVAEVAVLLSRKLREAAAQKVQAKTNGHAEPPDAASILPN